MSSEVSAELRDQWVSFWRRINSGMQQMGWDYDLDADFTMSTSQGRPYGVRVVWRDEPLTEAQIDWFRSQRAFPHFVPQADKVYVEIHPMDPQPKPSNLYHATPALQVELVKLNGLIPGRITGVKTTNYPHAPRWIHLADSTEKLRLDWLLVPANQKNLAAGEYVIFRVDPAGIGDVFFDPFCDIGYVVEDDRIDPCHLTKVDSVTVPG